MKSKSHTILHLEQLGKRYNLARDARRHTTLRDRFSHSAARLWRGWQRASDDHDSAPGELWALRNVSFDVAAGEIVGILGRNGSGKSTLLKILARITEPTTGCATVRGRIGALLEIGTGFHMELSGRENIYLSGAILGMRRAEIRQRFDKIVDMSGVADFLDLPVKRYSSGMYLRLAFAVAAHLESDLLLLDEVLAVGDTEFQQTCQQKIRELAQAGRAILLVSHDMPTVQALCHRAVLLDAGQVIATGTPASLLGRERAA